jgi:periplasmic protein TonB
MSMAVSADIFAEHDPWGGPIACSVALHALLFGVIVAYGIYGNFHKGNSWGISGTGGGGSAMSATLVSSISVPLPSNPEAANVLANESKGLSQTLPAPKIEQPEPDAIPIPARNAKSKPMKEPPRSVTPPKPQTRPQPVEEVNNVIPFGEGGPVSGPYGVFSAGGAKGGLSFGSGGAGGGGDFGSKYGWYVDQVRRKVSENWLKYEVDPRISTARRVYVTFEITRDGSPMNVQVEQSSGVPSLDQSAVRALQRIDTFGPLPQDYSGRRVSVEFWFDYKR